MIPLGTVITRFRSPASITTYAVITLAIEPIGCSLTDDRDQRSAPVVSSASSANGARTPAGVLLVASAACVRSEAAARVAGPAATINPATNPAVTVDAASRPVFRIGSPSACPRAVQRILPARPVGGGRLRLNFLRTRTRPRPERG